MSPQPPQWTDFLLCSNCSKEYSTADNDQPITLPLCGHSICRGCTRQVQNNKCKFEQNSPPMPDLSNLPVNYALLQLVLVQKQEKGKIERPKDPPQLRSVQGHNYNQYMKASKYVEDLALYLQDIKNGIVPHESQLTKPMLRKLVNLIQCQLTLEEGRLRALRGCRALGERSSNELILAHQNPATLSGNLWMAVRSRGCQFLGPAMQEEALKLILLALEDGSELSRKVLVMFVVQQLQQQFSQASKTSIGHVVQLLYRASCFVVTKREGDSSLMRLKECYRMYDALRREHDAQVVQIAQEAGLRIAPDQWSALLYGDQQYKSHMQSIIDRLQSGESFKRCIQDLQKVVEGKGNAKLKKLIPFFEVLSQIDMENSDEEENQKNDWSLLVKCLHSVEVILKEMVAFTKDHSHLRQDEELVTQTQKFKTLFCRDIKNNGRCPRGSTCTFAHTEEELYLYRSKRKKSGLSFSGVREKVKQDLGQKEKNRNVENQVNQRNEARQSTPFSKSPPESNRNLYTPNATQNNFHKVRSESIVQSQPKEYRSPMPSQNNLSMQSGKTYPAQNNPVPNLACVQPMTPDPMSMNQRVQSLGNPYHQGHYNRQSDQRGMVNANQALVPPAAHIQYQYHGYGPNQMAPVVAQNDSQGVRVNEPETQIQVPAKRNYSNCQQFTVTVSFQSKPNQRSINQRMPNVTPSNNPTRPTQQTMPIINMNPEMNESFYHQYRAIRPSSQLNTQQQQIPMGYMSQDVMPQMIGRGQEMLPNQMPQPFQPTNQILLVNQNDGQVMVPMEARMEQYHPRTQYMPPEMSSTHYPVAMDVPVILTNETPLNQPHPQMIASQDRHVSLVSPQPGPIIHMPPQGPVIPVQSVNPVQIFEPNSNYVLQSPQPFQGQNIMNHVLIDSQPTQQRVVMPVRPSPVEDEQQETHSNSPTNMKAVLQSMNLPSTIDEASVSELKKRKTEIITKLIQNHTDKNLRLGQSKTTPSVKSDGFYNVWTCSSFLDSITAQQVEEANLGINNENDELLTNFVDVVAGMDTSTTQVTVRGTDHINPSHSNIEGTLDDRKMHQLLVKKNDYKNQDAPKDSIRSCVTSVQHYPSGPQDDDDEMIPFSDRPRVSKYGPIARSVRTRPRNSDLVQAKANADVATRPVPAVQETHQDKVYSSFESVYSIHYIPSSSPQYSNMTESPSMTNRNISATQAASNTQLLRREEAALLHNQSQDLSEDLQLAMELQQIELGIQRKKQKSK